MMRTNVVDTKSGAVAIWAVLALVVALIVGLAVSRKPPENTAPAGEKAVTVRTVAIEPRPVRDVLRLPARIEPRQEANLA
ncbi:MAG TPA: hypothetical protein PK388_04990, partial [Kiritimatiellia bacterium]|nr:hypothetical protein [Kiritimatiellia bacterium]